MSASPSPTGSPTPTPAPAATPTATPTPVTNAVPPATVPDDCTIINFGENTKRSCVFDNLYNIPIPVKEITETWIANGILPETRAREALSMCPDGATWPNTLSAAKWFYWVESENSLKFSRRFLTGKTWTNPTTVQKILVKKAAEFEKANDASASKKMTKAAANMAAMIKKNPECSTGIAIQELTKYFHHPGGQANATVENQFRLWMPLLKFKFTALKEDIAERLGPEIVGGTRPVMFVQTWHPLDISNTNLWDIHAWAGGVRSKTSRGPGTTYGHNVMGTLISGAISSIFPGCTIEPWVAPTVMVKTKSSGEGGGAKKKRTKRPSPAPRRKRKAPTPVVYTKSLGFNEHVDGVRGGLDDIATRLKNGDTLSDQETQHLTLFFDTVMPLVSQIQGTHPRYTTPENYTASMAMLQQFMSMVRSQAKKHTERTTPPTESVKRVKPSPSE